MKIRSDFVTNSSSSSYIIAKKNDCTKEDILQIILNEKDNLKHFVNEDIEYTEYSEEFDELNTIEEKIQLAANYISSELYNTGEDMKLDDWSLSVVEGSNESENILRMYLYCRCGSIDTEKMKIKWSDC